jgi:hypothetical protein
MEKIQPSVLLPNGQTVTPPGWMWVLAFALRGVPWAIEEADKPEFRAIVKEAANGTNPICPVRE